MQVRSNHLPRRRAGFGGGGRSEEWALAACPREWGWGCVGGAVRGFPGVEGQGEAGGGDTDASSL